MLLFFHLVGMNIFWPSASQPICLALEKESLPPASFFSLKLQEEDE